MPKLLCCIFILLYNFNAFSSPFKSKKQKKELISQIIKTSFSGLRKKTYSAKLAMDKYREPQEPQEKLEKLETKNPQKAKDPTYYEEEEKEQFDHIWDQIIIKQLSKQLSKYKLSELETIKEYLQEIKKFLRTSQKIFGESLLEIIFESQNINGTYTAKEAKLLAELLNPIKRAANLINEISDYYETDIELYEEQIDLKLFVVYIEGLKTNLKEPDKKITKILQIVRDQPIISKFINLISFKPLEVVLEFAKVTQG